MNNRFALFGWVVVLGFCLAGCGGGGEGGEGASPSTQTPSPTPSVIYGPVTSVPAATYKDSDRLTAFERINEIRRQVGLGLLAQNDKLDLAAENHALYVSVNGLTHLETPGNQFFYAERWFDRAAKAGYYENAIIGETLIMDDITGVEAVNDLMATAYHRISYLNYANIDVGMGWRNYTVPGIKAYVTNFGYAPNHRQGAPLVPYVVWPPANSVVDRLKQALENPDPGGQGYAVSLMVDPSKNLEVEVFELRDGGGGIVSSRSLNHRTDQNLSDKGYVAILSPLLPLKAATRYTAKFVGSAGGEKISTEWSFTTP